MSNPIVAVSNIPQMSPGAFFEEHRDEVIAAMARVVDSGWYILGREVEAFEQEFAQEFSFAGAVGVGNGTDAIALALRALGIGRGDRVATVSHTAVATVAAIEMAGACPVFIDISSDTYTMDPESLRCAFQDSPPIRAVIPVHLYGHPADTPAIVDIAHRNGAFVLEDCSQSHGAQLDGQFVGSQGDIATFSFYPTKNLGAVGDGGIVVAADPELLRRVRSLRQYGWQRRYISDVPGINSRLDELQAAVLRIRLRYLLKGNTRRATIAAAYNDGLNGSGLIIPTKRAGATHVYHQYVVRCPNRDRFREQLQENGIGTNIHYPVPVHSQPAYAGKFRISPGGLTATDAICSQILSLPMYPELSDAAVARIVETIRALV